MNLVRKYKQFIIAFAAILICLIPLMWLKNAPKEAPPQFGQVEKQGYAQFVPEHQLSREKLIIGVSGITGMPYIPSTQGDETTCALIYEPLLSFDAEGNIFFLLAEKLDINESGDIYTLYIDKNRQFTDGTPVTPEDVKASYQLISDSSVESKHNAALSYIDGYREFRSGAAKDIKGITLGNGTVTFQFSRANWRNIDAFSIPITNAASLNLESGYAKHALDEKKFHLLGTGAYVLKSVNADGATLFRAEDQGEGFQEILITPVGITSVAPLFKNGTLDIYPSEYDEKLLDEIEEIPQVSLYSYSSSSVPYVGINCRHSALSDAAARKSISLAIQGRKNEAQKQLKKAGYEPYIQSGGGNNSKVLSTTIITHNAKSFTAHCAAIVKLLEESGIMCEVEALGISEFRERIKNEDFDLYYTVSKVDKHGSMYFENNEVEGLEDENIQAQKKEMQSEITYEKYREHYFDLVREYEEGFTRIALDNRKRYVLYSPRLKNISPGAYVDAFWNIER